MKSPNPDLHTNHILSLAKRVVSLPVIIVIVIYRWLKKMVQRVKSSKELDAKDHAHQSQVRRELRGLPPDHVQRPATKP